MSRRYVYECDRCGAECFWGSLAVVVGSQADPATGRLEDREEEVDLCGPCLHWAFPHLLHDLSHAEASAWLKKVRQKIKPAG